MKRIMFVCLGNICRSPMAEFILKEMTRRRGLEKEYYIASAAVSTEELGNPVYPPALRKLREKGVPVHNRGAQQIRRRDYDEFDYILCMEGFHCVRAKRICGGDDEGKIMRLLDLTERPRDIADPWYSGDFELAYEEIVEGCEALIDKLEGK